MRPSYRIMGVDPGTQKTGAAVLAVYGDRRVFEAVRFRKLEGKHLGERLDDLDRWLRGLLLSWAPVSILAWEREFQGFNWNTMGQLSKAIGVVERLCATHCRLGIEINPTSARKAVFKGNMNYDAMREILMQDHGVDTAPMEEDAISAMIQARAAYEAVTFLKDKRTKGFDIVFQRKGL